ncbi:unnamed protein product [Protopolystoma xenopodis]|uniref:Uncharacterized protein n=1 Tax=Protopolystoma xenopodis TaxID=117903 RepID=A0A448XT71_9PLAT|nr:unnamed protein product [Protopolystoma xenopodis]
MDTSTSCRVVLPRTNHSSLARLRSGAVTSDHVDQGVPTPPLLTVTCPKRDRVGDAATLYHLIGRSDGNDSLGQPNAHA